MIIVYRIDGLSIDWLMGERGEQKGKVPAKLLELRGPTPVNTLVEKSGIEDLEKRGFMYDFLRSEPDD